jgi:Putative DNA-binding domain
MHYLTWVQRVFEAAFDDWTAAGGVGAADRSAVDNLAETLGVVGDPAKYYASEACAAINGAAADLQRLGLISVQGGWYTVNPRAEHARKESLAMFWQEITAIPLTPRQEAFVAQLARMGSIRSESYALLARVDGYRVLDAVPEEIGPRTQSLAKSLATQIEELGLATAQITSGLLHIELTYAGLVRATKKHIVADQLLVSALHNKWETTEVDFKEGLNLATKSAKAEFARDVLGLVNPQASTERYLVLGFKDSDPEHRFTTSVDPRLTNDRLEDILHNYCSPVPLLRYRAVPWEGRMVGLIEVVREPNKLPYRATQTLGKLVAGTVYVRHGTHVTSADPEEENGIAGEGDAACGKSPRPRR